MIDRELKNYLLNLAFSPQNILNAAPFYLKVAKRKLLEKQNKRYDYYPDSVRKIWQELHSGMFNYSGNDIGIKDFTLKPPFSTYEEKHISESIMLVDGLYFYNDKLNWRSEFEDAEKTVSLHRWNWLLTKLTECRSPHIGTWGINLMTDWIRNMDNAKESVAWESYSSGERICNGLIFLTLTGHYKKAPRSLLTVLRDTAFYLADNLEYMPGGFIFNHVLNNARALYFAGRFFNIASLSDLAKAIFEAEMHRLINTDGFLREGSSHYQFLVARWFLEIYWLAKISGDDKFCAEIADIAKNILPKCRFFLVFNHLKQAWGIPLIGDISPDFTPEWLMDVPWSSLSTEIYKPDKLPRKPVTEGWAALFPSENSALLENCKVFEDNSFQGFSESGWFRLDFGAVTMFWHIEPMGSPIFPTHSHCDTGSFVLYLNGEQLLIDIGRFSYLNNAEGFYGISASAHNQITVDGMDPFIYNHWPRYPDFYRIVKPVYHYEWTDSGFQFYLRHEGFGRIFGDKIIFERTFNISKNQIIIHDNISGGKTHDVTTYFHWAPNINLAHPDDNCSIEIKGLNTVSLVTFSVKSDCSKIFDKKISINRAVEGNVFSGWYYPSYGRKEKATTLVFSEIGKLPMKNTYILSWKE